MSFIFNDTFKRDMEKTCPNNVKCSKKDLVSFANIVLKSSMVVSERQAYEWYQALGRLSKELIAEREK